MIEEPKLLVRTPLPHSYESLLGYVLRVSEENGYSSLRDVLRLAEIKADIPKAKFLSVCKLAKILGFDAGRLDRHSHLLDSKDQTPGVKLNHHDLGRRINRYQISMRPRICPLCIEEDGYVDVFWDLSVALACPRHSIIPLFKCHECNKDIEWTRPGLLACKCGADYAEAPLEKAPLAPVELMQIIYAKVHDQSILAIKQASKFPLEEFEHVGFGQFLHMLHEISALPSKHYRLKPHAMKNHDYWISIVNYSCNIFSDWPNGFAKTMSQANSIASSTRSSNNFWKKYKGVYKFLIGSSWFDRNCDFLFNGLINFGVKNMAGSLDGLIKSAPIPTTPLSTPLSSRLNLDQLNQGSLQQLIQLRNILSNIAAARHLGLPQRVMMLLDKEGAFDKFSIQGCLKTPEYPWNREELNNIILAVRKFSSKNKVNKGPYQNTTYLSKVLDRPSLDNDLKDAIVRDIFNQRLGVVGWIGLNLGGLMLDSDALSQYIFHRSAKNHQSSLSLDSVKNENRIPTIFLESLIHLGLLDGIRVGPELKVMRPSLNDFDKKFIGKDSLIEFLGLSGNELDQRLELMKIPAITIPSKASQELYLLIPRVFISRLSGCQ